MPCHCTVAVLLFRSCHCRCARERNCWKRLSIQNADWLSAYGRTAKIGFDPICYGSAVTAQRQVGTATATAQRNFFYVGNVILTALTEFLQNLFNGNGRMATEWWKLGVMLHFCCLTAICVQTLHKCTAPSVIIMYILDFSALATDGVESNT